MEHPLTIDLITTSHNGVLLGSVAQCVYCISCILFCSLIADTISVKASATLAIARAAYLRMKCATVHSGSRSALFACSWAISRRKACDLASHPPVICAIIETTTSDMLSVVSGAYFGNFLLYALFVKLCALPNEVSLLLIEPKGSIA